MINDAFDKKPDVPCRLENKTAADFETEITGSCYLSGHMLSMSAYEKPTSILLPCICLCHGYLPAHYAGNCASAKQLSAARFYRWQPASKNHTSNSRNRQYLQAIHTAESLSTAASQFRIASMTKSFTAMAIVKLRDEGKLSLDDPASKYIPQMKAMPLLTKDAAPVTIRHLLTHDAGFPEDNPWGDRQLEDSDEQLMALLKKGISFSNVPGAAYEYSNLAFALLGHIVSVVSGKPYQQYIMENILQPLGMTHTYWEYTKVPANELAHGYRWLNNNWIEQPMLHDGSYGAMGGLITSIEDFSRYMALHLSAMPPTNDAETGPIKRSSLREMQQPWNINTLSTRYVFPGGRQCGTLTAYCYGLRWMKDCDNKVYVGHSGGLPGFGSEWKIMPEYGIGIVSFANLTYAGLANTNLQVLDTLIHLAQLLPRRLPPSLILQQRRDELLKLLPSWKEAKQAAFSPLIFLMIT